MNACMRRLTLSVLQFAVLKQYFVPPSRPHNLVQLAASEYATCRVDSVNACSNMQSQQCNANLKEMISSSAEWTKVLVSFDVDMFPVLYREQWR